MKKSFDSIQFWCMSKKEENPKVCKASHKNPRQNQFSLAWYSANDHTQLLNEHFDQTILQRNKLPYWPEWPGNTKKKNEK